MPKNATAAPNKLYLSDLIPSTFQSQSMAKVIKIHLINFIQLFLQRSTVENNPWYIFVGQNSFMLIGEISKKTGLTRDTIRFYEKQGLIKIGRRERRVNNYKEYSDAVLKRLLLINKIKSYGFTLNESAEIISLLEAKLGTCDQISKAADKKIAVVEKKIQELISLKTLLQTTILNCKSGSRAPGVDENCPLFNID